MQATYTWTPTAADLGTNAVRVSVRKGGSTADFEDTATLLVSVVEGGEEGFFLRNPDIRLAWWKRWFQPRVPASLAVHHGSVAGTSEGDARRHSLYTPELQLLAETQITTSATPAIAYEYIWFAGRPLAQVTTTTGAIDWYFNDHLGTPILQTDGAANLVWRVEHDPYGSTFSARTGLAKHQPLRFPGQENEGSSELSYNVFRPYRASWGRYPQADPLDTSSSGVNNGYRYALSNPLRWKDPTGLESVHTNDKINCAANPLDCVRVYKCRKEATEASEKKYGYAKDHSPQNAFKHCYWNCCMAKIIGPEEAKKFGDAHENYRGNWPCWRDMDLWNNEQGRRVTGSNTCNSHCQNAPLRTKPEGDGCDPCSRAKDPLLDSRPTLTTQ